MTDDKRELLKLKQGLVTEEQTALELEKTPVIKPTGKAAVENFFYHNRLQIIFASVFLVIAAIFAYFALTDEKADITVLFISDNADTSAFFHFEADNLELAIEQFIPVHESKDKHIPHAKCLFIDLVTQVGQIGRNPDAVYGERIKLFAEVRSGNALIYIGNKQALEGIPESGETPVEDFYEVFHPVKDTAIIEVIQISQVPLPDDLYFAIRHGDNEDELAMWEWLTKG